MVVMVSPDDNSTTQPGTKDDLLDVLDAAVNVRESGFDLLKLFLAFLTLRGDSAPVVVSENVGTPKSH